MGYHGSYDIYYDNDEYMRLSLVRELVSARWQIRRKRQSIKR